MKRHTFTTPGEFLAAAQTQLEKQEVINSLVLGIPQRMMKRTARSDTQAYFAAVFDDGKLVIACFMTPPHGLVLSSAAGDPHKALHLIAEDLHAQGWPVPNVLGPNPLGQAFAHIWGQHTRKAYQLEMGQRIYELREVVPPPLSAPGELRLADPGASDLLAEWLLAFDQDAFGKQVRTAEDAFAFIEMNLEAGGVYIWHDGAPVSMVMRSRPTRHGITVNMVYTPPELRRRGYASASVAALSQRLLDEGYDFCTLFTDAANPTSNKIYMQIGYQAVCDFDKYAFNV